MSIPFASQGAHSRRLLLVSASIAATTIAAPSFAQAQDTFIRASSRDGRSRRQRVNSIDLDEIIVTGSPIARPIGQTITNTTIFDGEKLAENLENSIGETLRREPGISSTFFGAGASRPIIRGLGGDRVRVLEDGIGSFDAAQTSPDHAVPVEPALAERIEIFRGPASLLYGSSAAGGVVNTDTGKIPSAAPEDGFDGALRYSHSTVNNGDEVAGGFNLGLGSFVIHAEGAFRDADDYDIPGLNGSEALIEALSAAAAAEGEVLIPPRNLLTASCQTAT